MTLIELTVGALNKEFLKAREQAVLRALDDGFKHLRWLIYSDVPDQILLEGYKQAEQKWHLIAMIHMHCDMRSGHDFNPKVEMEYRGPF